MTTGVPWASKRIKRVEVVPWSSPPMYTLSRTIVNEAPEDYAGISDDTEPAAPNQLLSSAQTAAARGLRKRWREGTRTGASFAAGDS